MEPQIIRQGHCTHIVIDDQSPQAIALMEAIFAADQLVRKECVTTEEIQKAYDAVNRAEKNWCKAHGFEHDSLMLMALVRLAGNLYRAGARHATA